MSMLFSSTTSCTVHETDIYKELSDFLDNVPDITILMEGAPDILDYYILETIEKGRMNKERLNSIIKYCLQEEYTSIPSLILVMSHSVGILTRGEVESFLSLSEWVSGMVSTVLDERETYVVGVNTDRHILYSLFNCVAMISTERLLNLAKSFHKVISCEDLLEATIYYGSSPTKYNLLVERVVIGTCYKPLIEYEYDINDRELHERITRLINTLDQV